MNGRLLYEKYGQLLNAQNVGIDEFDDLPDYEQAAWEALAVWIAKLITEEGN